MSEVNTFLGVVPKGLKRTILATDAQLSVLVTSYLTAIEIFADDVFSHRY